MAKTDCLCRKALNGIGWFFSNIFPVVLIFAVAALLVSIVVYGVQSECEKIYNKGFEDGRDFAQKAHDSEIFDRYRQGYYDGKSRASMDVADQKSVTHVEGKDLKLWVDEAPDEVYSTYRRSDYPYLSVEDMGGYWKCQPHKTAPKDTSKNAIFGPSTFNDIVTTGNKGGVYNSGTFTWAAAE